jgi:hypothetical protein
MPSKFPRSDLKDMREFISSLDRNGTKSRIVRQDLVCVKCDLVYEKWRARLSPRFKTDWSGLLNPNRLPLFLTLLYLSVSAFSAIAQEGQLKLEPKSLESGEAKLAQIIQDGLQRAGGKPETESIRFVVAFKTGFFKDDPVRADAVREVATALVKNSAVAGDRITARAFEFGLWDHKSIDALTLTLAQSAKDDPNKTSDVSQLWPLTPKSNSLGGHDLERAAVELDAELGAPNDTVMVLLTNAAASQGAPGEQLIGSDSAEYQAMLEHWDRIPGTKDGATLEIPFQVLVPNESPTQAKLAAVVFVPKTFSSTLLGSKTRTELLNTAQATPVTSPPAPGGGFPLGLLAIPVLGAAAWFAYKQFGGNGGGGWVLEIMEGSPTRFAVADAQAGRPVVVLAGAGFTNDGGDPISTIPKAPAESFARFIRDGNSVRVESTSQTLELKTFDGDMPVGAVRVKPDPTGPEHVLEFAGSVAGSSGVPRHTTITVRFRVSRGEG